MKCLLLLLVLQLAVSAVFTNPIFGYGGSGCDNKFGLGCPSNLNKFVDGSTVADRVRAGYFGLRNKGLRGSSTDSVSPPAVQVIPYPQNRGGGYGGWNYGGYSGYGSYGGYGDYSGYGGYGGGGYSSGI
nr:5'-3' exoribonuclease 2-like [Procambarus clarkii]